MATVKLYNQEGSSTGEIQLDAGLFDVAVNPALVHEAVVAQSANARASLAHTKTRGEVRGGGKKPWKQKGTGRARHGSRRSPIWSGGGITFGPRSIRNFAVKMNRKARRKALAMVLSDKVMHDKLIMIDALMIEEGKTKQLSDLLSKLPSAGKKTIIITAPDNKSIAKAAQNLQGIESFPANALNVIALLRFEYVIVSKPALEIMTKLYNRV
jgi:large subunit ribosomal protein L4